MSDCNCEEVQDEETCEEQTYEAYIQAGQLAVAMEGESSEDAETRVLNLWEKAVDDVRTLNEEERRSVGLK